MYRLDIDYEAAKSFHKTDRQTKSNLEIEYLYFSNN